MNSKMDFNGATVLITGGTGSFGKAFLEQLLPTNVREIRIFSRDELKQDEMRSFYNDARIVFYIGDVRQRESVDRAMEGVDFVFHAAALKQVPSCEFFPLEAIRTNVLGSANLIESSRAHAVKKVVCLSTDKAVYPINAMGLSKALMEKVAVAAARAAHTEGTIFSCVRYGNVMYSRGSVIPLFVRQIKSRVPLTVTVPNMTRFLLALPDAIDLVKFAITYGDQGDLFVKKAPACTVDDLACALLDLFGCDLPVKVIGMRHGEKLFETLASSEELARADDMGDYYRIPMDGRNLNYGKYFVEGDVKTSHLADYHSHNTERLDLEGTKRLLLSLPELRSELIAAGRAEVLN